MSFLASIFGTILYFIYNIVNNYGFAIILFSVLLKIVLLPLSIKQQRTVFNIVSSILYGKKSINICKKCF